MPAKRLCLLAACLLAAVLFSGLQAQDFDLAKTRKKYEEGDYKSVSAEAAAAVEARERGEEWRLLWVQSLLNIGKYPDAADAINISVGSYSYSIRLRLLAYETHRANDQFEKAQEALDELEQLGGLRRYSYREPAEIVAIGQAALLMGADPRLVLDNFYEPVLKANPDCKEAYLAKAQLGLTKSDYALASKAAQAGLQKFPNDLELLLALAEAFSPSDRSEMLETISTILEKNENYVPARLLLVDHLVDAESYKEAEQELEKIHLVNPAHPEAWAYRGVMAHLKNDLEGEKKARAEALRFSKRNPKVDHILGKKLSQKYRFAEGSKYQAEALKADPDYLPARFQLATDLLRLGQEEQGWKLAEAVAKADPYNVGAFNLVTLKDTIAKYKTVTNEHFIVRMKAEEAEIFGKEALDLLEKARVHLSKKYELTLDEPVVVEIFDAQKDFAVRTFGMPGGEGYLGVCFGDVITANSPTVHQMNWKAVLWHEFAHVITLNLTRNRMPRWFSEGISVYEERLADPRWGEQMDPAYHRMILDDEMKKVGDLSSAFLAPPTPLHIQFAYYQSSLVVEFIVQKYGLEKLKAILRDLGQGVAMNDALATHCESLSALEKDFEAFAKATAKEFGDEIAWSKPKRNNRRAIDPAWAAVHKENYWLIRERAEEAMEKEDFVEAEQLLQQCLKLYPRETGSDSAFALLAQIYRQKKDSSAEREILRKWVRHDAEAEDAMVRLLELELPDEHWSEVHKIADYLVEVNPMRAELYRARGLAAGKLGGKELALDSWNTLLKLKPQNPAEVHFELARLYGTDQRGDARKHILLCLEEAPRYREAHRFLLELVSSPPKVAR